MYRTKTICSNGAVFWRLWSWETTKLLQGRGDKCGIASVGSHEFTVGECNFVLTAIALHIRSPCRGIYVADI